MGTRYSGLEKKELDKELIVNKKKFDTFYVPMKRQEEILEKSNNKRKGRIRASQRLAEKYQKMMGGAPENLKELYFEYLDFNRNGQIPELIRNPDEPTTNLLTKYKSYSEEVKKLFDENKKIPRGDTKDGELRSNYIKEMKNIEKEIYKRFFSYKTNGKDKKH